MEFEVRALNHRQQVHTLRLQAMDADEARRQTGERGYAALSVRSILRPSTTRTDAELLIQQLHSLLQAGLSAIEAIDALIEGDGADPGQGPTLRHLATCLREGSSLSLALQSAGLDAVLVGVVQAAEGTGDVPVALGRYLAYRQRLGALRQQVTSAVLYPAILLAVGALVTLFLLGYVVPRFALVMHGSGRDIPWASMMLMNAGLWLSAHWTPVCAGALAGAATVAWRTRKAGRSGEGFDALARLPVLGSRLRTLALARFYLTLGMLVEGGIAAQRALVLASQALEAPRRSAASQCASAIGTGVRLSAAMDASGLCTPVALRLIRAGEQSGQLGSMLMRAAAFHDAEAARWIERFSKAFEPLLMAAIGLVIGVIVVLLYMPIFDLASSIG